MKKKLFLVLCSCFAGALALSSCGGGGGGSNSVSELLKPFVNGNYAIVFESMGESAMVVANGTFQSTRNETGYVAVYAVPISYRPYGSISGSNGGSGFANYTIYLDTDGPRSMEVTFFGLTDVENEEGDGLLPFKENLKVTMAPDPSLGFNLGAHGEVQDPDTITDYQIVNP